MIHDAATIALAASLALGSVEQEDARADPVEALRGELDPMYQRAWDDPADVQDHLTGRRRGKTEYFARRLAATMATMPRSINPYILPTAKQARLVCWPILRRVVERHLPDAHIRDNDMTITMPHGGTIVCGGCECRADIGKWFGLPFGIAVVDECGVFPEYLRELIDEALEPGMLDFGGKLLRGGNPGPTETGPWFEWTNENRLATTPLYTGDARDNPHLSAGRAEAHFAKVLEKNGWTWDTPVFVRMYLGRWKSDPGSLVYPWNIERNAVTELPTVSASGDPVPKSEWRHVIGADIGYVDATAFVVVAYHPALPHLYVVHAETHTEWIDDQKIARLRELAARFPNSVLEVDPGGGGKNVIETMRRRYTIPIHGAEKQAKIAAIRETRDAIQSGRMMAIYDAAQPLIDECAVLGWDDKREKHDANGVDHACDALLYATRRARHYQHDAEKFKPRPQWGTPEHTIAELAAIKRQYINPKRTTRPSWDR